MDDPCLEFDETRPAFHCIKFEMQRQATDLKDKLNTFTVMCDFSLSFQSMNFFNPLAFLDIFAYDSLPIYLQFRKQAYKTQL